MKHWDLDKNIYGINEYLDLEILPRTLSKVNMEPTEGSKYTIYSLIQFQL